VVAGIPQSGFELKIRVYDEDPEDHDDLLGKVKVEQRQIGKWKGYKDETFKIHKTGASIRAYAFRSCMSRTHKQDDMHGHLVMSIEVLGKTEKEVGKAYTMNSFYRIHYSPMIGKVAGTKAKGHDGVERVVYVSSLLKDMYH